MPVNVEETTIRASQTRKSLFFLRLETEPAAIQQQEKSTGTTTSSLAMEDHDTSPDLEEKTVDLSHDMVLKDSVCTVKRKKDGSDDEEIETLQVSAKRKIEAFQEKHAVFREPQEGEAKAAQEIRTAHKEEHPRKIPDSSQVTKAKQQIKDLEKRYEELKARETAMSDALAKETSKFETSLKRKEDDHAREIKQLLSQAQQVIESLNEKHQAESQRRDDEHATEMAKEKAAHRAHLQQFEDEIKTLRSHFQHDMEALNEKHKAELQTRDDEHAKEMAKEKAAYKALPQQFESDLRGRDQEDAQSISA